MDKRMTKQTDPKPLCYTPAKAADKLGLCEGTLRQMLYKGELPSLKVGKCWLIPAKALEAWLDNQIKEQAKGNK
jgi:excisionase family DNA binding protein